MQCLCQVKLTTGGGWKDATLTDEHPNTSGVVVTVLGVVVTPGMSDRVRVPASCPLSLFDAAINVGYHVLGVPRSDNEPATTYRVMRGWLDGEIMKPHLVAGPFDNLDEAVKASELQGGAVVRDSDGAVLTPKGWVNVATGDLIVKPVEEKKQ